MPGEGDPPEIEVEVRELEIDGIVWSVEAAGRARVRTGGAGTPVLQLVFRAEGRDPRESLVVGRRLDDLTDHALVEGLRTSGPHRADVSARPFFEGTEPPGGRRGR